MNLPFACAIEDLRGCKADRPLTFTDIVSWVDVRPQMRNRTKPGTSSFAFVPAVGGTESEWEQCKFRMSRASFAWTLLHASVM